MVGQPYFRADVRIKKRAFSSLLIANGCKCVVCMNKIACASIDKWAGAILGAHPPVAAYKDRSPEGFESTHPHPSFKTTRYMKSCAKCINCLGAMKLYFAMLTIGALLLGPSSMPLQSNSTEFLPRLLIESGRLGSLSRFEMPNSARDQLQDMKGSCARCGGQVILNFDGARPVFGSAVIRPGCLRKGPSPSADPCGSSRLQAAFPKSPS